MKRYTVEYNELEKLKDETVFFSEKSGRPYSRIEVYPSGANRVIKMNSSPPPSEVPIRDVITSFSDSARRRYWIYCNRLMFDKYKLNYYFVTLTFQDTLADKMTLEQFKKISKILFKRIIRAGFDYVYKLEFTKKEVPHYHLLVYGKHKVNWNNETERLIKNSYYSNLWTTIVINNIFTDFDLFSYTEYSEIIQNMRKYSVDVNIPKKDFASAIAYYSFYTTKNKDYQNLHPKKYIGLKFWGYGRENYGKKILGEVEDIPISNEQYTRLFQSVKIQYESHTKKKFIKPYGSGFFLPELGETLCKLTDLGQYRTEDDFYLVYQLRKLF